MLAGENRGGTLKSAFVWKMKELDEDMRAGKGWDIIHRRVLDILGEQRLCMIQFECCLDEFNAYLAALRVLDTLLQHGIFEAEWVEQELFSVNGGIYKRGGGVGMTLETLETASVIGDVATGRGERIKVVKGVRCYWEKSGKCRIARPEGAESAESAESVRVSSR